MCVFVKAETMRPSLLRIALAMMALGGSAAAQTDTTALRDTVYILAPMIVNPTLATERSTPATFSNLGAEELRLHYSVQDIPAALSELPSMTFYSENGNAIGYNYVTLRGFDQRRLSVMVNGVPQNDPEDHNVYWIDFPDLMSSTEQMQVQRGAGSAFYGPPAIGGSINLVTNPFARPKGIALESMFGFQERGGLHPSVALATRRYTATINSGLIDGAYMLYGKLGRTLSEGYRDNSWVAMDSYFLGGVRIYKDMTLRFHLFGGPITDGLAYEGLPKFVNGDPDLRRQNLSAWETDSAGTGYQSAQRRRTQETESFAQPHYEFMQEWRVSATATLSQTLFYYTGEGYFDYDASWADTSLLRLGSAYGIPASQNPANTLVRAFVGNRQWGWLPRVELRGEDNTLTLGVELRVHRSTHWGKIQYAEALPQNFDPDYHFYEYEGARDIFSVFAHNMRELTPNLTLMTDVQAVRNRYAIRAEKFLGNNFSLDYFFVNPRIGLNYNIDEAWHAYFSGAYTSREPTLRNLYAAEDSYFGATPQFEADTAGGAVRYRFDRPLAKPERLLDLEAGTGWRANGARLNVSAFWMEFFNELVKSGQVDIFGQPVTGNAEHTRHAGVEFDGEVRLTNSLTLGGNAAFSHNRLIRYTVLDDNGVPVALDGNPIAGFPDFLGNLRLTYSSGDCAGSVLLKHVGAFHTDNTNNDGRRNDAYTVLDATGSVALPPFGTTELTLRGEVRNVLNSLYFMSGEGTAFFPAAERSYLVGLTVHL